MTYKSPGRHGSGKLVSTYDTHKKNTMETRFKTVDVVVENDINFSMVKMTIEFVFGYYIGNYEYQCAFLN